MTDCCPISGERFEYLLSLPMRDAAGKPPTVKDLYQCRECMLLRLDERHALDETAYETHEYRASVNQAMPPAELHAQHLPAAQFFLRAFREFDDHQDHPMGVCLDVGAGAGTLLDQLRDVASTRIAVEPSEAMGDWLAQRHDAWYRYLDAVPEAFLGRVDHAFCVTTLEHVRDPWVILRQIRELLAPDGALYLVVPAPNPGKLFSDAAYRRVFFCAQHRWYFTAQAFKRMLAESGLALAATMTVNRGDGWWYHVVKCMRGPSEIRNA